MPELLRALAIFSPDSCDFPASLELISLMSLKFHDRRALSISLSLPCTVASSYRPSLSRSFNNLQVVSRFNFQVKTHSESGVLFYNTGPSSNKDFVALEVWKGLPRLLVDQVSNELSCARWAGVSPRNCFC